MYKSLLVGGALLAAVATSASAATQNGEFEIDPGVAGKTNNELSADVDFGQTATSRPVVGHLGSLPGWTTLSEHGVEVQNNRTLSTIDAHSGNYYIELDSNGNSAISQDFFLDVGEYVLSFWYSPRVAQVDTNDIAYALGGFVSGIADSATAGAAVGTWTEITARFNVLVADTYSLGFAAGGVEDTYGGLLDDVSLVEVAAVPVPAASLLFISALGALFLLYRRTA